MGPEPDVGSTTRVIRRVTTLVSAGAALIVALVLAAGCGSGSSTGSSAATSASPQITTVPPTKPRTAGSMSALRTSDQLQAVIDVGDSPDWQTTDGHHNQWVSSADLKAIQRIDRRHNTVTKTIRVGTSPCDGLAATGTILWVVNCETGQVLELRDDGKLLHRIKARPVDDEGQIAGDDTGMWMTVQTDDLTKNQLIHIDAGSGKIDRRVPVPGGSVAIARDPFGQLWVTNPANNTVTLFSPVGRVLRVSRVPDTPRFLAASDNAAWVLSQRDGVLSRVDMRTGKVTAIPLNVPGDGGSVAYGADQVWVSMPGTPLIEVNADTYKVEERFHGVGGDYGDRISYAGGSVWLSNHELNTVWRLNQDWARTN